MSSENSSVNSGGIGCLTTLTIIFVVLKLVGVIDWSWWLVLLPSIIGVGIYIVVLLILWIIYLVVKI